MAVEFDPTKDADNIAKHHVSLARAGDFEMLAVEPDVRFDYGEDRYRAWGRLDGEFYCLVFAARGENVRAISLRRAHDKEVKRHVPQDRL